MLFAVNRLCGACGRQIPRDGSFDCGTDHAPTIRCPDCGNEIDPEWCHCGDAIKDHQGMSHNHSPVPMGCSCGYALIATVAMKAEAHRVTRVTEPNAPTR